MGIGSLINFESLVTSAMLVLFFLTALSLAILFVVVKIHKMHNVRNSDGEYAWMVPTKFVELQSKITESQEMIVRLIEKSSENTEKAAVLLGNLVDVTKSLHQKINGQDANEKR